MITTLAALLAAATLDVTAGGDLAATLAQAAPGDVVRVGPGHHLAALGTLRGVRVEGAGAGRTLIEAPEGADGAWIQGGESALVGLSLVAGPERCALVVRSGGVTLEDVGLAGGSCGARVDGGSLRGKAVELHGRTALVVAGGEARLTDGSARGDRASALVHGGLLELSQFALSAGRESEAVLVVAGGKARLSVVTIRSPGALGISASSGAEVTGDEVDVIGGGATEDGIPGACILSRKATVRLTGGLLARCGGAALQALGGKLTLAGVDAVGGVSGCLLFLGGATGDLAGNACAGRGPGVLATSGAKVSARLNTWWTTPVRVVECASGARIALGRGERGPIPCSGSKSAGPLDKRSPK